MLAEQDTSIPRARETEHDMIRHSRTRMQQTFLLIPLLMLLFFLSWMVVTNPGAQWALLWSWDQDDMEKARSRQDRWNYNNTTRNTHLLSLYFMFA